MKEQTKNIESIPRLRKQFERLKEARREWEPVWRDCYAHALPLRSGFATPATRSADPLFDGTAPDAVDLREVARAAARSFGTDDGRKLLAHLRAITVERACGPQVSDAALRDLEGQRRLVHRLTALIDRGHRGD